jgi:hypothetical protein
MQRGCYRLFVGSRAFTSRVDLVLPTTWPPYRRLEVRVERSLRPRQEISERITDGAGPDEWV